MSAWLYYHGWRFSPMTTKADHSIERRACPECKSHDVWCVENHAFFECRTCGHSNRPVRVEVSPTPPEPETGET